MLSRSPRSTLRRHQIRHTPVKHYLARQPAEGIYYVFYTQWLPSNPNPMARQEGAGVDVSFMDLIEITSNTHSADNEVILSKLHYLPSCAPVEVSCLD